MSGDSMWDRSKNKILEGDVNMETGPLEFQGLKEDSTYGQYNGEKSSANHTIQLTFDAVCLSVIGFIDATVLVQQFASDYWHLLNVYNLGFDVQALVGPLLGLIILPAFVFIGPVFTFAKSRRGVLLSMIGTFLCFLLSLQTHESVRTFLSAAASTLVLSRMYVSTSAVERCGWVTGFWLMVLIRWSNSSIQPLDLPNRWYCPVILGVVGVVAIARLSGSRAQLRPPVDRITLFNLRNGAHDTPKWIAPVMGISGGLGLSCSIFMLLYMFSSDAVTVRWNGGSGAEQGAAVVVCLMLGAWLHTYTVSTGNHTKVAAWISRLIAWILLLVGAVLAIVSRGSPLGLAGGCIAAIGIFVLWDMNLTAMQGGIFADEGKCMWRSLLYSILMGLWLIISFVAALAWFAGTMVPLFGTAFWSNEVAVWTMNFVPALVFSAITQIITFFYVDSKPRDRRLERVQILGGVRCKRFFSAFSLAILVFVGIILLPASRWRRLAVAAEGSADKTEEFTVMTWNLQMGYGLYPKAIGFQSLDRTVDVIGSYKPHFVGLQEVDAANILHGNRDIIGFLADNTHMFPFYGPPAWTSTPGVGMLTSVDLKNKDVVILERGDEALHRLLIHAEYAFHEPDSLQPTTINVFNTHISAFSDSARTLQLNQIADIVRETTGPLVMTGDFNNPPNKTQQLWNDNGGPLEIVHFAPDLMDTESLPFTETAGWTHIDHIYYRDLCLVSKRIVPVYGLSDHVPVIARFVTHLNGQPCKTGGVKRHTKKKGA